MFDVGFGGETPVEPDPEKLEGLAGGDVLAVHIYSQVSRLPRPGRDKYLGFRRIDV
jgi:hypothetical protein